MIMLEDLRVLNLVYRFGQFDENVVFKAVEKLKWSRKRLISYFVEVLIVIFMN